MLHIDPKGLDRFQTVAHRIHGHRSKAGRRRGMAKEYLSVAIDDATRLAQAEMHPRQGGPTRAAVLTSAIA